MSRIWEIHSGFNNKNDLGAVGVTLKSEKNIDFHLCLWTLWSLYGAYMEYVVLAQAWSFYSIY